MTDAWRMALYPLGFLSSIAFGSRFLLQWGYSEYQGKSVVPKLFWRLSLAGNCLLLVHAMIQLQYHIAAIQVCNAVIAWRNLNLMTSTLRRCTLGTVLTVTVSALITVTGFFALQGWLSGDYQWLRIPQAPWQHEAATSVAPLWHLIGFIGMVLFGLRFWLQWWHSERREESVVNAQFWIISLVGASMQLAYFLRIMDMVNLIGPTIGMIPYMRNLMLLRKNALRG